MRWASWDGFEPDVRVQTPRRGLLAHAGECPAAAVAIAVAVAVAFVFVVVSVVIRQQG